MGVGGVMGYEYPQGTPAASSPAYTAQAIVHPDLVYTAQTGDVVTDVGVWVPDYNDGDCNMAIYEVVSGVPTNRVGPVVNVPVPAYTTLTINKWYRASCSIPLTAGTTYCVAIDYVGVVSGGWFFTYGGITGMTAATPTSNDSTHYALESTWTQSGTDANIVAFQARVTGTDSTQLLADKWTAANGTGWNSERWPVIHDPGDGIVTIDSTAGHIYNAQASADSGVSASDFELVVKLTFNTAGSAPEIGWRTVSGIDPNANQAGYCVQLRSGSGGGVDMWKIPGYDNLASVNDTAIAGTDVSFWFKIRVVGTNHKVRWWPTSGSEPGTWQMDVNHTSFPYDGGRFMLRCYYSTGVSFDDLTVTDLSGIVAPKAARYSLNNGTGGYTRPFTGGTDVTICGWFRRISTYTGATFFAVNDNGSNYWGVGADPSGSTLIVARTSGDYNTGHTIALDTWYHVAASVVNATGITTLRVTPLGGSPTTLTSGSGTVPGSYDLYTCFSYGGGITGDIANLKVWTAALSGAEIDAEAEHYRAVRTSNLWGEYSFYNGSVTYRLDDLSGNGRHMLPASPSTRSMPYTTAGPPIDVPAASAGTIILTPTRSNLVLR